MRNAETYAGSVGLELVRAVSGSAHAVVCRIAEASTHEPKAPAEVVRAPRGSRARQIDPEVKIRVRIWGRVYDYSSVATWSRTGYAGHGNGHQEHGTQHRLDGIHERTRLNCLISLQGVHASS